MKLAELIRENDLCIAAETALKAVDWNFDVNGVEGSRFARGKRALSEAQTALRALYKVHPEDAELMWKAHGPVGNNGVMPTWILA